MTQKSDAFQNWVSTLEIDFRKSYIYTFPYYLISHIALGPDKVIIESERKSSHVMRCIAAFTGLNEGCTFSLTLASTFTSLFLFLYSWKRLSKMSFKHDEQLMHSCLKKKLVISLSLLMSGESKYFMFRLYGSVASLGMSCFHGWNEYTRLPSVQHCLLSSHYPPIALTLSSHLSILGQGFL